MNKLVEKNISIFNNKGFTLIELIVVLAVLSIILSIAVPSFISYTDYSKEKVCSINRQMLIKEYYLCLAMGNKEHSNMLLEEFVQENANSVCPKNGVISAIDDNIHCYIHENEQNDSDDGDDGEVPYL